jgi:lipopolysaccharide/colanic/teichoic acid biosynthesis glycosyltransferase
MRGQIYRIWGKRVLDVLAAGVGLIIAAPVCAVVALSTLMVLGRPVFFRQQRPGLRAEPFEMIKFRTMSDESGPDGSLLAGAERLRPFGRLLRATSLDELPELWNVLRGQMSLVGPRPLLMEYLPLYTDGQARRHEVRPGITGWAQVNGRNELSWEKKFEMDVWYVENLSFRIDLHILLSTIRGVVLREGISAEGHATMPRFTGSGAGR